MAPPVEGQTKARAGPDIDTPLPEPHDWARAEEAFPDGGSGVDIHIIRLRGGWECTELGRPDAPASRLDLPAGPDSFPAGRLRLTRRFNRPPRAGIGPVVLRLAHCPGILAISLNGQPLVAGSPGRAEFELSLGLLAPRNELQIEAEPAPDAEGWGVVHLVFGAPAGGLPTNG